MQTPRYIKTYPTQLSATQIPPMLRMIRKTKEKDKKTTGEIDKINLSELQKKGIRASPLTIFPFLLGETFLPLHSPLTGMRMGTVR